MSVYPRDKASELIGVLFLASSMLVVISLVSYNALDPSLNGSSNSEEYRNYGGQVGAYISDLLFQILGFSAFCLPVPLLFIGYKLLRGRVLENPFVKFFGFWFIVAALSTTLTLLSPVLTAKPTDFELGGVLGFILASLLLKYLNAPGSLVVVLTALLLSLIVTTRFSINLMLNWLNNQPRNLFHYIGAGYSSWQQRRRERRKLAWLNKDNKTLVTQRAPRKSSPFVQQETPPSKSASSVKSKDLPVLPKKTIGVERPNPSVTVSTPSTPAPSTQGENAVTLAPLAENQLSRPYQAPHLDFLQSPIETDAIDEQQLIDRAQAVAEKCAEFEVDGRVLQIHPGPVVTTFEFKPDPGVKYSRVTSLSDDLCLALKAESIRIDRTPGKNTVGIEVPNSRRRTIYLREILEGTAFQQSPSHLTLALGKLINGNSYVTDLTRMPHLLIAGATGSGKSVALNCIVCSVLYKASPAEVRFIMIDPKRLELGVYEDIPHLLTPIVTDPKKAANGLHWAVNEMERRYKLLAQEGVRNIAQYNRLVSEGSDDPAKSETLPYIVIIVDELADLMMTTGKEVEAHITRLAQMARAIGIHLILATQRPSVDVLTGLIKANFPCRISFQVSSKVDSRTILDSNGAEQLLGQGDMLFLPPGSARLIRIHGSFLSEREIHQITDFLKGQAEPKYQKEILLGKNGESDTGLVDVANMQDSLYDQAARFVVQSGKASTSLLQRRLRIGYGRAARILDMMEHEGLIGPSERSKAREILVPRDYFEEIDNRPLE